MPTGAEESDMQQRDAHAGALRGAGMHATMARVVLLDVLRRGGAHQEGDVLATTVRARVKAGLLRRIEPANTPALYNAHVGDHHLACRRCGTVRDAGVDFLGRLPRLPGNSGRGGGYSLRVRPCRPALRMPERYLRYLCGDASNPTEDTQG